MSALFKSRLFKFSDRRHVGVRKEDGPSHLEASLLEGRHLGKVPVGFASCFGYLLLA